MGQQGMCSDRRAMAGVGHRVRKRLVRLGQFLLERVPPHSRFLYRFCQRYVDRYRGEGNPDIHTNGELRLLREVLGRCRTVMDVGANVGQWTALALDINRGLTIHCFEPSPTTYQLLLAQNFPASVVCNNIGIGSRPGDAELYVYGDGSGMNSLYSREGLAEGPLSEGPLKTERVRLETLDGYCSKHRIATVDFLKVDVEGHELDVFRGAMEMLRSGAIRIAQFEYGGCNIDARVLLRDLFALFSGLDYDLLKVYPDKLRPVHRYEQHLENFRYQNWLAVHAAAVDELGIV